MDWIVPVSRTEAAGGLLAPETVDRACRALRAEGVALMRGVFPEHVIDGLHQEYLAQYGALDAGEMAERASAPPPTRFLRVGSKRYEITPRMDGAFADSVVFANPLLRTVVSRLLGKDIRLGVFTVVVSFPGASIQHFHRDHPHLFPEGNLGTVLPAYAINVALPLIDVDLATGPTGLWPGSHLWTESREPVPESMTSVSLRRGDCLLLDYRTFHAGLPNRSSQVRPVIYMAYSRGWFFDEVNHKNRLSLDMSLETFLGFSEPVRDLLLRAYSQAMRSKQATETET